MTVGDGHSEWPDLEQYSDLPVFNTKAVVQQTGVSAPTLRAWERRYTLLSPERAQNDYRLYSERDIAMIRWLKEHVDAGMSISQAIALFRHTSETSVLLNEGKPAPLERFPSPSAFSIAVPTSTANAAPLMNEPPILPSSANYHLIYNMHAVRENMLEAFNLFDETTASTIMASLLSIYSIEQVCTEFIVPILWQIGQLWEEGKITVSVEHFASAFFRGLLSNLMHSISSSAASPLVIVCCAPGEPHELAPLMLSLFLRRTNIRVAFLGQSIETAGLLQTIRQLSPAMLCVSLTISAHLPALIDLGQHIQALPTKRPIFAFGGQVFIHYKQLIAQVPGTYLDGNLPAVVTTIAQMIAE